MNEKNLAVILGLIILIAVVGFASMYKQSSTGMVVPGTPVVKPMLSGAPAQYWREVELTDHINGFFKTNNFIFPQDKCGKTTEQLFQQIKQIKTTGIEEINTEGNDRFKTLIFKENYKLGQLTLIQGFETPETTEIHATLREMVMTVDGWKELLEMTIEAKGTAEKDRIVFNQGKAKALDFECSFGQ